MMMMLKCSQFFYVRNATQGLRLITRFRFLGARILEGSYVVKKEMVVVLIIRSEIMRTAIIIMRTAMLWGLRLWLRSKKNKVIMKMRSFMWEMWLMVAILYTRTATHSYEVAAIDKVLTKSQFSQSLYCGSHKILIKSQFRSHSHNSHKVAVAVA